MKGKRLARDILPSRREKMKNKLYINFSRTVDFPECGYEFKMMLRRAVAETLSYEMFDYDAEVSITLCDNAYIRELNKKFRDKDKHTDVLSFPIYDFSIEAVEDVYDGSPIPLGDIVISVERAREQAEELSHSFEREAQFLTIHSTLHLLGYDHERGAEDEEAQCTAQREIIENIEPER